MQAGGRVVSLRDVAVPLVLTAVLFLLSRISFLWFHTFAELFAIVVGVSLFIVARASYGFNRNGFLLFLAQGFFWAACIDAVHTMTYSGIGLLAEDDPNPPTQLWLLARMLEAVTLAQAPRHLEYRGPPDRGFAVMGVASLLGVAAVFTGVFPDAFIAGSGLTPFKIATEYAIIAVLAAAAWHLHVRRAGIDGALYSILMAIIALTAVSEFAFTLYVSVYGLSNLVGHIAKLWAFWLLLQAIWHWMLGQPFRLLSRDATSFDAVPVPVLVLDRDGIVQSCNESARQRRRDGGVGRRLHDEWHSGYTFSDCPVCEALSAGRALALDLHDPDRDEWASVQLQPVQGGETVSGFIAVHVDITARKKAAQALQAMNREIQDLYDNAPCGYHSLDADGRFLRINDAGLRLLGYARDELVGRRRFDELLAPGSMDAYRRREPMLRERGQLAHLEVELVRKDGSSFFADLTATAIYDSGGGYLASRATFTDVTERRLAEHKLLEAEKMEAIGQLTGGLAHDFNNLLGIILGGLDMLGPHVAGDEKAQRMRDLALRAANRAAEVTKSLLAVARKQPLSPTPVDIDSVLTEMMPLLRQSAGNAIEVADERCEQCRSGRIRAIVDTAGLGNALLNLVINARDAMPDGGRLLIETRLRDVTDQDVGTPTGLAPGLYVTISVSDSGHGIPAEILAHVFEPFFTTKQKGKGTGLGLAMVYGFARQSGGTATVYSQPGIGTTFRLYLPAAVGTAPGAAGEARVAASGGHGERILVVDDEADLRDLTCRWLAELGYSAVQADSPDRALELLAESAFDLLLTDVVMPGTAGGVALAGTAAERWPALPILLCSGYTGGAADVRWPLLQKPYGRQELAAAVTRTLSARQAS